MLYGEFVSMKTLREVDRFLVPKPIAWGTYAADPDVHFFLSEFVFMDNEELPDTKWLAVSLAKLHEKGVSPNGKYGFPVPTFQGTLPQYTAWTDSWEEFFSKSIKLVMENDLKSQGPDPEVQELYDAILTKIVPRLLRPLETGGRQIQPRLVSKNIHDSAAAVLIGDPVPCGHLGRQRLYKCCGTRPRYL